MSNVITIDLDKWTTQAQRAKAKGCSIQYINRLSKQGKIASLNIPQLNIVLVEKTEKQGKNKK